MTKVTVDGSGILSSSLAGLARIQSVPNPTAPTVTVNGVTGTTTYSYYIVAIDKNGNKTAPSLLGTVTTGNTTLSASNYNNLSWSVPSGAVSVDVIRSVGGTTQGSIALSLIGTSIADTGLIATIYTAPVRNNTADLQVDGNIGIGVVPSTLWQESLAGTINVPVGVAVQSGGINISPNIVAANNSDVLIGLMVQPTFNDNGKTGVGHLAAQFNSNVLFTSGLQVSSGNIGVLSGPLSWVGVYLGVSTSIVSGGATGSAFQADALFSGATVGVNAFWAHGGLTSTATASDYAQFRAANPSKGTGAIITNAYGLYVDTITSGTNNYGIYVNTPTGGTGSNIGIVVTGNSAQFGILVGGSNEGFFRSWSYGSININGVSSVFPGRAGSSSPLGMLMVWAEGSAPSLGLFAIGGAASPSVNMIFGTGIYSSTVNTASRVNVYWSGADYVLQNNFATEAFSATWIGN